ncbi:MAG: GtrA family protein, partial [Epsilonproteobacteria bacterium]|nr:GtrA family protein [Campylobacterota bacterium]
MIGKFFIVGAISTAVDYGIYSLLVYFGIPYYLAIVVGYMVGLLVNFWLARTKVFTKGSRFQKGLHEFLAVFGVSVVAVGLNIAIVWALAKFGIDYYT